MSPLTLLAVVCACTAAAHGAAVERGLASATASAANAGGDARLQDVPWHASVQAVQEALGLEQPAEPVCSGTLIDRNWVLTSAHCVHSLPASTKRVEVVLGRNDLDQPRFNNWRISVTHMLVHEGYDAEVLGGRGPHNIALLKMSMELTFSRTVRMTGLPYSDDLPSGDAVVSGWGYSENGQAVRLQYLRDATVPIVDLETCRDYLAKVAPEYSAQLTDDNLCVGPLNRSACAGDDGAPLVQGTGFHGIVVGVASWGQEHCGTGPLPSVFTRVSAYTRWIRDAVIEYRYQ